MRACRPLSGEVAGISRVVVSVCGAARPHEGKSNLGPLSAAVKHVYLSSPKK